jgi:chaperonin GroES
MIDYSTLQPLGENFLIRRVNKTEVSKGGIALPDQAQTREHDGHISKVGTGNHDSDEDWHMDLSIGDKVLLSQFGGADLGDYAIIPATNILGVYNNAGQLFPVGRNILVRMAPRKEQLGAIVIPEFSRDTETWGVVTRVGEHAKHVSQDSQVYILPTQGTHYRVGEHDFIIVHEEKVTMSREWVGGTLL